MFGKKKKNAIAYGIIGLGRFGEALATELARSGAELLVMDREEERVREMRELTENALVVNTLDKKTLTETGIQNCDIAVVCIGEHMESSILTTLNLVSLGIPTVIAKATSPEHGEILNASAHRSFIPNVIWQFAWQPGFPTPGSWILSS